MRDIGTGRLCCTIVVYQDLSFIATISWSFDPWQYNLPTEYLFNFVFSSFLMYHDFYFCRRRLVLITRQL